MLSLQGKRFVIVGLQGSGKTIQAKHILSKFPRHIVVDFLKEYSTNDYKRYVPTVRERGDALKEEMNTFFRFVANKKSNFDMCLVDEGNRIAPNKGDMPPALWDLNDFNRHWDISLGFIARRPVQLNTDLVELAHYIFIYKLTGKNDKQYLNYLHEGLGDSVEQIQGHQFIFYEAGKGYQLCSPVPMLSPSVEPENSSQQAASKETDLPQPDSVVPQSADLEK